MNSVSNTTTVVNVKVVYIRDNKQKDPVHIRYENLKEWIKQPDHVYIGRAGIVFIKDEKTGKKERFPKKASIFANPFKVRKNKYTNETVCDLYESYMTKKLHSDPHLKEQLMQLKGKKLGCWCKPKQCHGDILVKLIDLLV